MSSVKQQPDKKRSPTNNQTKRIARVETRETKLQQGKGNKTPKTKEANTKGLSARPNSNILVSNRNKDKKTGEVGEKLVVNHSDKFSIHTQNKQLTDLDKELDAGREESDSETVTDSISSSGDSRATDHDLHNLHINNSSKDLKVHPKPPSTPSSISSEGFDGQDYREPKEVHILDEASIGVQSDDEMLDCEENTEEHEAKDASDIKIAQMEMRIEKLEDELIGVAALEVSLYSVVQEHCSSAQKVNTPAHRLSRLYIHARKHLTQEKCATISRIIVSGLITISTSCGNDVSRLTFWLSNIIVLREIITKEFGSKQNDNQEFMKLVDHWQKTQTFISELEKVETGIFSIIIESIWSQTLTPFMLKNKTTAKLLTPATGEQQQSNGSINLWQNAFNDAFKRLCPVRSAGQECGCIPELSRMIMEQCVARLDVAMFNAVLSDSAHEISTNPASDTITESSVLPIQYGELSFGSGAQLKKAAGNWSRWLTDRFTLDTIADHTSHDVETKWFHLLNSLSHLLMVPKDMLTDTSIREEMCPSISLPLLKRILCKFTPDEFCPDPVPNTVLEALNAESIKESGLSEDNCFPYPAATIIYKPPSIIQMKGYTSNEGLEEELDSSPTFLVKELPAANGSIASYAGANARYQLLREVWSS